MTTDTVSEIIDRLATEHDIPNLAALRPVYLESLVSAAVERQYPLSELDVADGLMSDCELVSDVLDAIAAMPAVERRVRSVHWALVDSWLEPGALAA